ncbi:hypothetical protein Glove_199g202 [Diversispora epigaea]|uniref:Peptidase A2 domain-containing protein n=1 Tax=Diversispora epigaea TaxID=1348612 RepID=A0A397IPY3_9GLOM|nr:hypothetical protein Glove_199g202 [Diversispora epigaea]
MNIDIENEFDQMYILFFEDNNLLDQAEIIKKNNNINKELADKITEVLPREGEVKVRFFVAVKHSTFRVILYSSTLLATTQGAETTDLTEESIITTREPDQEPSTNTPDQPETNAMAQNTQGTTAEDTAAQNIASTLDALDLDLQITVSNPLETVESLRMYEKKPGEAQMFLGTTKNFLHTRCFFVSLTNAFADRTKNNFRWPASMPNDIRSHVFWALTDNVNVFEGDQDRESALNFLYFYDSLDKGIFDEHKKEWVLVYGQKVIKYGSEEYTNQQLSDLEDEMVGAIYLPIDPLLREQHLNPKIPAARAVHSQRSNDSGKHLLKELDWGMKARLPILDANKLYKTVVDTGAPETILPYIVRRSLGKKGWFNRSSTAPVWEPMPGDQVDSSLIGNDILDEFNYVHKRRGPFMFLNSRPIEENAELKIRFEGLEKKNKMDTGNLIAENIDEFLVLKSKERVSSEIKQRNREKKLQRESAEDLPGLNFRYSEQHHVSGKEKCQEISVTKRDDRQKNFSNPNIETKEYLSQERPGSESPNHKIYVSEEPDEIEPTKSQSIEQGLTKELQSRVTDKTARTQLYKEMLNHLPGITSGNLRMKTLRAKKIQMLFGKIGVGIEKLSKLPTVYMPSQTLLIVKFKT